MGIDNTASYGLGDEVLFQPNLDREDTQHAVTAKVVAVTFVEGSTLYDIALYDPASRAFYIEYPLRGVNAILLYAKL